MLKVIGAGYPRTGTSSMKAALERLGFGPCYHMYEVLTQPAHVDRWLPVTSGEPVDWEKVFDGYQSAQDWPASGFWREQAEAFPDAKVILTVRDPRKWYVSMQNLMANGPGRASAALPENLPPKAVEIFSSMMRMRPVMDRLGRDAFGDNFRFGDGGLLDENRAVEAFERHVATVKESLPPERLLVLDVREGWEPLCAFLGVPVPADEPFPHLNDSDSMKRMLEGLVASGTIDSPFSKS
ncbi:sulfotransferase family protein [Nonomuraea sp. B12E4]|uniref:sulfotransferase family protein n=1 Tax=Nonomuraea sp. B12E4 TaxID=3153564 RepID=UPI00325EB926